MAMWNSVRLTATGVADTAAVPEPPPATAHTSAAPAAAMKTRNTVTRPRRPWPSSDATDESLSGTTSGWVTVGGTSVVVMVTRSAGAGRSYRAEGHILRL